MTEIPTTFLKQAYAYLHEQLKSTPLQDWAFWTEPAFETVFRHGDLPKWLAAFEAVSHEATHWRADGPISLTKNEPLEEAELQRFEESLRQFHPWRKGPFQLFELFIDTEWRSDWKWARLAPHLSSLQDRMVLDIGSGNGFYGWQMLKAGARQVVGVDPFLLFVLQWALIAKMIPLTDRFRNVVLPLGVEMIPKNNAAFDTVFSMGVLYHRRDPILHLKELLGFLKPNGELVLETLVLSDHDEKCLFPYNRYAKMRNVWSIPSVSLLEKWLHLAGFKEIRTVDVTPTSTQEQRRTAWMTFESLPDFLDAIDPAKTIEGYPAPIRAVVLAKKNR
ncbi:MAG: tRNA 5-methoxyuridine(34)/uridine 5-oxyacetic acid(34) synthase CmoB [Rhodothermia bacterium]|nr:tRNA 5-methoxyuridine(34)/uridine 5-oxyacetic acid(34) synthase CmoB [Rhodothermia bacterium]